MVKFMWTGATACSEQPLKDPEPLKLTPKSLYGIAPRLGKLGIQNGSGPMLIPPQEIRETLMDPIRAPIVAAQPTSHDKSPVPIKPSGPIQMKHDLLTVQGVWFPYKVTPPRLPQLCPACWGSFCQHNMPHQESPHSITAGCHDPWDCSSHSQRGVQHCLCIAEL